MTRQKKTKQTIKRIGGYLHRLSPVLDSTGKVVSYVTTPLMVELKPRDIMQIIVGASILAIPVGFTEETWSLGERLPFSNILVLAIISLVFIALFVYFNFYRFQLKNYVFEYIKRVIAIYVLSLIVVGMLLTIIEKCPWGTDTMVALKRIIIVAFPSSMSAAISDTLK
ncbi:MAG: DUF2391 family protein [Deltaproteobacteria bacterium]|nr:DUF2391 family protein [Deltaproteobacteria bacterium]